MERLLLERDDNVGMMYRHWSPISEKYTGGDALLTAVEDGWRIIGVIFRQEYWLAGVRRVCVFHVELERDGEVAKMTVVHNPYVIRFLREYGAQVVLINQRVQTDFDRWS